MRTLPLQLLTWGTATAAISSAVWLSSTDQALVLCSVGYRASSETLGLEISLPATPARAGLTPPAGSSAARGLRPLDG